MFRGCVRGAGSLAHREPRGKEAGVPCPAAAPEPMETTAVHLTNRAGPDCVALETTLLAHGVPRDAAPALARDLEAIVRTAGARPATVGVLRGVAIVGMNDEELGAMLAMERVAKGNTSNLGVFLSGGGTCATTVSATMELGAAAGVRVFATGGVGGVHKMRGGPLDVSADILAFARFPVAVVSSGVKAILDVASTREAFETIGAPVIGWRTDDFPAFYLRDGGAKVDARFDEMPAMARFVRDELRRTGRGVLVCNPIPEADEIAPEDWSRWLAEAERRVETEGAAGGRDATPRILAALHELSGGATLRANIALVKDNARVAAELCAAMMGADARS